MTLMRPLEEAEEELRQAAEFYPSAIVGDAPDVGAHGGNTAVAATTSEVSRAFRSRL